jgi:hypothetical protein
MQQRVARYSEFYQLSALGHHFDNQSRCVTEFDSQLYRKLLTVVVYALFD